MELFTILKQGEGPHTEFKEDFPEQAHKIAKEMVAFANSGGGILFIGVDDEGVPKGLSEPNKAIERLSSIARSCSPPLLPKIDKIQLMDKVSIIYAKVHHNPPCLYQGKCYVRVGSFL
jgi:predicted HTH transcriptional regulator